MSKPFFSHRAINTIVPTILATSTLGWFLKAYYGNNILYTLGIGLGMFWAALILYWLKKVDQFWYGVIEILVATMTLLYAVSIYALDHNWDDTSFDEVFKRAALIYLIIRGMGNVHEGLKNPFWLDTLIRPYWAKLTSFLFRTNGFQ